MFQALSGLGLMLLSVRPETRLQRPVGILLTSSGILPPVLIYRHSLGPFAGETSLEVSKMAGAASFAAWLFLALA